VSSVENFTQKEPERSALHPKDVGRLLNPTAPRASFCQSFVHRRRAERKTITAKVWIKAAAINNQGAPPGDVADHGGASSRIRPKAAGANA
jgi:hypothetical protein